MSASLVGSEMCIRDSSNTIATCPIYLQRPGATRRVSGGVVGLVLLAPRDRQRPATPCQLALASLLH
eukprot:4044054-Alexandrium_andersonii.AAC.1